MPHSRCWKSIDEIPPNHASRFALKYSNVMPTRTNISQSHKISLRLLDSCRSISRRRRRRHRYLVQPLPAPFEKFRSQLRRLAISPAAKPPPMSAAVCDSWMALQPFIHDRKLKDGVSNATVDRALEVVRRILNVAHQDWRWLKGVPKIRMLRNPGAVCVS